MPNTRLFVGNLPYATTEQELRELFGRGGAKVGSVRVITDFDSGRSKGYAFVELSTAEEGEAAVRDLNGLNLGGRAIVVSPARARQPGGGPGRRSERTRGA
jgi:RNA recognition motif-containing protein